MGEGRETMPEDKKKLIPMTYTSLILEYTDGT